MTKKPATFLPPDDVPTFGQRRRTSSPINWLPRSSIGRMLSTYMIGVLGPWLVTVGCGVLAAISLVYWIAPDYSSMFVRFLMPDSIQTGWDALSDSTKWVRSRIGAD